MAEAERAPRRRPSLLVQIAVALALVGIVPLALAVWQLIRVNRDALFEQLLRTHTVAARTAADTVDGYLAGHRSLAGALAADPRLVEDPASDGAQRLFRDSLAAWTESGVAALVLLDGRGDVVLRAQTRGSGELVAELLDAGGAETRLVERDGAAWAAIPVPLTAATGTLLLVADAAPVARALKPDELGEQAQVLLIDRAGNGIWGAPAGAGVLPGDLAAAALSGQLAGAGRFRDASGREIVAAWSGADGGRWIVVSVQPGQVAEAAALRMARRSGFAVAASLALVGLLSLAAWKGLVRPLRALLAAQRAERGESAAGAPSSETAELASALAELERRGKERSALDEIFLGRYQVLALVGSGGMGSVYRGWDPRLQRPVALKTIQFAAEEGAAEQGAAKLLAEAVAVAQITHPNVVAVYDAEESGGAAFVAMEFVHGIGLDKYLEKRGRLDWREGAPLGAAIARGLAAAHARELVHRDIKPGNVLLGHDGSIKIADFGLATFLHRLHEAPGKVFGTPGFLAPEALQGLPIDARSDLYALGVVLFRALSGRYPVRGTSFRELVNSTVRDPAPRPEELDHVPAEVAELVCALLEKDPERRLAPAAEVARRFDELVHLHQLAWRLDFTAGEAAAPGLPSLSTNLPTVRLDADLA